MSWSLRLSPRLSPAVLLGVSEETFRDPAQPQSTRSSTAHAISRLIEIAPRYFPEQLSAPCGARLALGVPATRKELPITAA
jgi:hypothetical protein